MRAGDWADKSFFLNWIVKVMCTTIQGQRKDGGSWGTLQAKAVFHVWAMFFVSGGKKKHPKYSRRSLFTALCQCIHIQLFILYIMSTDCITSTHPHCIITLLPATVDCNCLFLIVSIPLCSHSIILKIFIHTHCYLHISVNMYALLSFTSVTHIYSIYILRISQTIVYIIFIGWFIEHLSTKNMARINFYSCYDHSWFMEW